MSCLGEVLILLARFIDPYCLHDQSVFSAQKCSKSISFAMQEVPRETWLGVTRLLGSGACGRVTFLG